MTQAKQQLTIKELTEIVGGKVTTAHGASLPSGWVTAPTEAIALLLTEGRGAIAFGQ